MNAGVSACALPAVTKVYTCTPEAQQLLFLGWCFLGSIRAELFVVTPGEADGLMVVSLMKVVRSSETTLTCFLKHETEKERKTVVHPQLSAQPF